jgi:hypothetical protein
MQPFAAFQDVLLQPDLASDKNYQWRLASFAYYLRPQDQTDE